MLHGISFLTGPSFRTLRDRARSNTRVSHTCCAILTWHARRFRPLFGLACWWPSRTAWLCCGHSPHVPSRPSFSGCSKVACHFAVLKTKVCSDGHLPCVAHQVTESHHKRTFVMVGKRRRRGESASVKTLPFTSPQLTTGVRSRPGATSCQTTARADRKGGR